MKNKALITILLLFFNTFALAETAVVRDARVWAAPDNTRVVFDINAPVNHKLFTLSKPDRIVIDLENTSLKKTIQESSFQKGMIKRIRTGHRKQNDLRVVLDLLCCLQMAQTQQDFLGLFGFTHAFIQQGQLIQH